MKRKRSQRRPALVLLHGSCACSLLLTSSSAAASASSDSQASAADDSFLSEDAAAGLFGSYTPGSSSTSSSSSRARFTHRIAGADGLGTSQTAGIGRRSDAARVSGNAEDDEEVLDSEWSNCVDGQEDAGSSDSSGGSRKLPSRFARLFPTSPSSSASSSFLEVQQGKGSTAPSADEASEQDKVPPRSSSAGGNTGASGKTAKKSTAGAASEELDKQRPAPGADKAPDAAAAAVVPATSHVPGGSAQVVQGLPGVSSALQFLEERRRAVQAAPSRSAKGTTPLNTQRAPHEGQDPAPSADATPIAGGARAADEKQPVVSRSTSAFPSPSSASVLHLPNAGSAVINIGIPSKASSSGSSSFAEVMMPDGKQGTKNSAERREADGVNTNTTVDEGVDQERLRETFEAALSSLELSATNVDEESTAASTAGHGNWNEKEKMGALELPSINENAVGGEREHNYRGISRSAGAGAARRTTTSPSGTAKANVENEELELEPPEEEDEALLSGPAAAPQSFLETTSPAAEIEDRSIRWHDPRDEQSRDLQDLDRERRRLSGARKEPAHRQHPQMALFHDAPEVDAPSGLASRQLVGHQVQDDLDLAPPKDLDLPSTAFDSDSSFLLLEDRKIAAGAEDADAAAVPKDGALSSSGSGTTTARNNGNRGAVKRHPNLRGGFVHPLPRHAGEDQNEEQEEGTILVGSSWWRGVGGGGDRTVEDTESEDAQPQELESSTFMESSAAENEKKQHPPEDVATGGYASVGSANAATAAANYQSKNRNWNEHLTTIGSPMVIGLAITGGMVGFICLMCCCIRKDPDMKSDRERELEKQRWSDKMSLDDLEDL